MICSFIFLIFQLQRNLFSKTLQVPDIQAIISYPLCLKLVVGDYFVGYNDDSISGEKEFSSNDFYEAVRYFSEVTPPSPRSFLSNRTSWQVCFVTRATLLASASLAISTLCQWQRATLTHFFPTSEVISELSTIIRNWNRVKFNVRNNETRFSSLSPNFMISPIRSSVASVLWLEESISKDSFLISLFILPDILQAKFGRLLRVKWSLNGKLYPYYIKLTGNRDIAWVLFCDIFGKSLWSGWDWHIQFYSLLRIQSKDEWKANVLPIPSFRIRHTRRWLFQ